MSLLVVGCVCLAAIMNMGNMRGMFAAGVDLEKPEGRSQEPVVVSWKPAAEKQEASSKKQLMGDGLLPAAPVVPTVMPARTVSSTVEMPKPRKVAVAAPAPDVKSYKGEKYKYVRTLRMRVTAYAPDGRCCWPYPGTTTATGLSVKTNRGRLVAADPRVIPMHSLVVVPGYSLGNAVPVLDTGGAIKGNRLDVMLPSYEAAKEWGSRMLDVKVYAPAD